MDFSIFSTKVCEKINSSNLDGSFPRVSLLCVYVSQLIRFDDLSSNVCNSNSCTKFLNAKIPK